MGDARSQHASGSQAPVTSDRSGTIRVPCHPVARRLFRRSFGAIPIVAEKERRVAEGDRIPRPGPGFWAVRGYRNRGDPRGEQRYADGGAGLARRFEEGCAVLVEVLT